MALLGSHIKGRYKMTYQNSGGNKLVAVIKVNGKVLRESVKGEFEIPFGSEYSILVKNLNTVRIQVRVNIDGDDATGWVIIQPNSSVELERFIKNGNLQSGNRFKFIEKTEEIEQFRENRVDDGMIRIEYKTEKVYNYNYNWNTWTYTWPGPWYTSTPLIPPHKYTKYTWNDNTYYPGGCRVTTASCGLSGSTTTRSNASLNNVSLNYQISQEGQQNKQEANDAGITVPGSQSNQQFYEAPDFVCETNTDVLILTLKGKVNNHKVVKPQTVEHKLKCITCGSINRGYDKFCSRCGTSLKSYDF